MGEMQMLLPDNTLPMMTGFGSSGPSRWGCSPPSVGEHRDVAGGTEFKTAKPQGHGGH
jgi:hypothetical protein